MLLNIVSYNGTALNDSNFSAWFGVGQPSMPGAQAQYAPRSQTFPKLSSKDIGETTLVLHIECKGTIHSQLETLKALFPVDDYTFGTLIAADSADSNRQWYVKGYAISPVRLAAEGAGEYVIELALDEPCWRTVTVATAQWLITATGQEKELTILGNRAARLIMEITPTAGKGAGYLYQWWRPWHNPLTEANGEPLDITNGGFDTAALIADNSNKCQVAGGVDDVVTTIPYDTVTGSIPSTGMGYCGTEQIRWTGKTGTTSGDLTGVTRGVGGTTAASHADNVEIKVSKMLANGDDLRVFDGTTELDRWLSGINTSSTKVWINALYAPRIQMTLSGAIAGSGAVTTINVKQTKQNLAALKRLPKTFIFYIGTEVFFGSNAKPKQYRFTVTGREQRGSTIAAHSDGDTIVWLEHDLYIMYGNASADAPTTDDTKKPILDLANSTNASWVYTEFASEDGLREGGWTPSEIKKVGNQSTIYTGTNATLADPAAVMGFALKAWNYNDVWRAETASFGWQIHHPAGFTTITVTGDKRRMSTDWPTTVALRKSLDGINWTNVFNEATPGSSGSWAGSLASHSGVSLSGNYPFLQWFISGSVKRTASNEVDAEIKDGTFALNSSNIMQLAFATSASDNYFLDATITVRETGESITLTKLMKVNQTLTVDCDAKEIHFDEQLINPIRKNTIRGAWLDCPPGTVTLQFDDVGTTGVTIDIDWEHRNDL